MGANDLTRCLIGPDLTAEDPPSVRSATLRLGNKQFDCMNVVDGDSRIVNCERGTTRALHVRADGVSTIYGTGEAPATSDGSLLRSGSGYVIHGASRRDVGRLVVAK